MALQASGQISLADIRTEFGGGSGQIALGDFYRGGSHIRAKAGNNNATNLAASVPASGTIDFNDFYSTAKAFRYTYTSGATNQDASSVFGSDYGVDYPKEIVINSGVELGATSTGQEALQINSGLSGSMTVTNNGTISGAGGSANGGSGGDAFEADASCTLINNGTIRSGGGGGGAGGGGGQGRTSSSSPGSWTGYYADGANPLSSRKSVDRYSMSAPHNIWYWNATILSGHTYGSYQYSTGGYDYESGSLWASGTFTNGWGATEAYYRYRIRRRQSSVTTYYYHSGGTGGAGGVGQGYNQVRGGGHGGSSPGNNSGNGGTGGDGGLFGQNGSTGNSGGNGNYTNGSGGSGGGSAGKYIRGLSNVSFTNNGTVQGGTA